MKADVLCAWCGKFMYEGETPDGEPSHGICDTCVRKHFPDFALGVAPTEPTPNRDQHPTRKYVQFAQSNIYHFTDDDTHTLCNILLHGPSHPGHRPGLVTADKPKYGRLCTHCHAAAERIPEPQLP